MDVAVWPSDVSWSPLCPAYLKQHATALTAQRGPSGLWGSSLAGSLAFKVGHGSDWFTVRLFESGYPFRVRLDDSESVGGCGDENIEHDKKLPVHCTTMSSCFDQFKS